MKKIASTLFRFGPPLAGSPSVFCGVFEMMWESVRMIGVVGARLIAEPLDHRERVRDRVVLRDAVPRVRPGQHRLAHPWGAPSWPAATALPPAWSLTSGHRRICRWRGGRRLLRTDQQARNQESRGDEQRSSVVHMNKSTR